MYIVDLKCKSGHRFEGLYDSRTQYQEELSASSITCPLCDTSEVSQVLTTGGVRTSKRRPEPENKSRMPMVIQKILSHHIRQVRATSEFVPPAQFADKVIAMTEGREDQKDVYSEGVSREDTKKLDEKGISYNVLPIPDIENN